MSLSSGSKFAGYAVLRRLGAGGMGEVYLVQHPRLPRREALKVLGADVSADPTYRQRFAREAQLAASLRHAHIVGIHDLGEEDGRLWLTMDYIDGLDAARLLRKRYPYGMPAEQVLETLSAVAGALDYAHGRNLLHRDVKPANILIAGVDSGERQVVLADFGIVRDRAEASRLTATNIAIGTVGYAAPEQLTGMALDGRADQYALACTAFELFTGQPPFAGSNPAAVIASHLSAPRPRLGTMRAGLGPFEQVLVKAMARQPSDRFGSCSEFVAALAQQAPVGIGPQDRTQLAAGGPAGPAGANVITIRRRTALIGASAVVAAALGASALIGAQLGQPERTAQPPTRTAPYREPAATAPRLPVPPPVTVTQQALPPVTVTRPAPPPVIATPPKTAGRHERSGGDLGLAAPMSFPSCNGQGVVILGSVTTPGLYAVGVQRLLNSHPGASYLRTDRSCPSLRQATAAGDPIYAVFTPAGRTQPEVCAAVRTAGGDAYGKWLDTTTAPEYIIPC